MNVLGISAFYHDSAAALVQDGKLVAAAQEERFTRRKHDDRFPINAIRYCLDEGGVARDGLDAVVYYDKPITTFVRLLKTYLRVGPKGLRSFCRTGANPFRPAEVVATLREAVLALQRRVEDAQQPQE